MLNVLLLSHTHSFVLSFSEHPDRSDVLRRRSLLISGMGELLRDMLDLYSISLQQSSGGQACYSISL